MAIGAGVMWFIIYGSYALAFWYGVKLIMDDREVCEEDPENCYARYTPASLLIVRDLTYDQSVTFHNPHHNSRFSSLY